MKRLRLWLRELSLTQQLLCIIFLFIAVFAGFIIFFLTPALDRFSETEMYELLHNSQETLISYVDENPDGTPDISSSSDASITQAFYDPDTNSLNVVSGTLPDGLEKDIRKNAAKKMAGTQDYHVKIQKQSDQDEAVEYLYSMTLLKDGRDLVSIMPEAYQVQFRKSLINGVVLMNVLVVSVLLVLLLMWTGSLIYPLGQIKNYIQKIKNDEPATLNVKRNDEIGEVAEALTDMEKELSKQNREKEEMIQNISHDLKTPIATIKSYAEAIKDGVYPYDTLEKSIDVIIEHADRLEKKVKSLIVLNKMGYLLDDCPEGDTLDMNDVIEKAILSLKVVRPEIQFQRETDPDVKFHGEEEPWRITVENLIDNALRYAKSTITITLHPGELCVINDGKQIEKDRLETLFHPYEMGSDGQFGLGLSIVWRVCTTYGYQVEADNMPDGVCFRIWKEGYRENHKNRKKSRHSKEDNAKKS